VYPLGRKVAAHGVFAAVFAAVLGWELASIFGLGASAPWLAGAVIVCTLVAAEPARRRVQPVRFGPANRITLARGILVGEIAAFMVSPGDATHAAWVTGAAAIALAMDGLDGMVARRSGLASPYGAQLDMELDSILMLVLSILAWQWNRAGAWVLFCGLARYAFLLAGLAWPWFRRELPPAFRRKTACVLGIGGLTASIWPWPWPEVGTCLAAIATGALFLSFGVDIAWLVRRRTGDVS